MPGQLFNDAERRRPGGYTLCDAPPRGGAERAMHAGADRQHEAENA